MTVRRQRKVKYEFNGNGFYNKKDMVIYVRKQLIEENKGVVIDKNHKLYPCFCELRNRLEVVNPRFHAWLNQVGVAKFIPGKDYRGTPEIQMITEGGERRTLAWKQCAQLIGDSDQLKRKDLHKHTINDQMRLVKSRWGVDVKCVGCSAQGVKIDCDHHPKLFSEIYNEFLEHWRGCGNELPPLRYDHDSDGGKVFKPIDCDYGREWRKWHLEHAEYQPLCKSCHKQKTKYDTQRLRIGGE